MDIQKIIKDLVAKLTGNKDLISKFTADPISAIKDLLGSNGKPNDYGNLHITDGTNELYVYGCYPGYGATGDNRKFFIKNAGIKEGDSLTMIGYKDTYNGLIELCGGIYFSHTPAN